MILIGLFFIYLAIRFHYEPLLLIPIALALPVGFYSRWQNDSLRRISRDLLGPAVIAVLTGILVAVTLPTAGGWGIAVSAADRVIRHQLNSVSAVAEFVPSLTRRAFARLRQ